MAISRERKHELVTKYVDLLSNSEAAVLVTYSGMSVAALTRLRRKLYECDTPFVVIKNTLFKRALDELGMSVPEKLFEGPVGIGFSGQDVPATVKVFVDSAKENESLNIKGGLLAGRAISADQVKALTDIPPREVLLSQLVWGLQAPISGFVRVLQSPISGLVNVLNGPQRSLVYVLQARVDQLNADAA